MYANEPLYLFITEVQLKGPDDRINDLIKLLPEFRYHVIINDEDVIGKFIYYYMTSDKINASKRDTILIYLLNRCNELLPFTRYYLLLLLILDQKITAIRTIVTYTVHKEFSLFVTDHIQKHVNLLNCQAMRSFSRSP